MLLAHRPLSLSIWNPKPEGWPKPRPSGVARRAVPSHLFAGAPRLHNGLMADEFPAILQKGETVLPKNTGLGGVNVTFNISTPNAQSFMDSQGQIMSRIAAQMGRHRARNG